MLYNIINTVKRLPKINSFSSFCKKPKDFSSNKCSNCNNYIYPLSTSLFGIGICLSLSFNHNEEVKKLTKNNK